MSSLSTYLTEHFPISEHRDPSIREFYVHKKRQSTDYEALKLVNVRSRRKKGWGKTGWSGEPDVFASDLLLRETNDVKPVDLIFRI